MEVNLVRFVPATEDNRTAEFSLVYLIADVALSRFEYAFIHHFTPLAHWGLLLCKPFQCWIILRNRVPKSNRHVSRKQRKILICYCQQSADFGIHHRTPLVRLGATHHI